MPHSANISIFPTIFHALDNVDELTCFARLQRNLMRLIHFNAKLHNKLNNLVTITFEIMI